MKEYDSVEVTSQPSNTSGETLGKFSLLTITLFTVLLIGGMIADKQRVAMAFLCGISFFSVFGGSVILVLSGQLTSMVNNYQKEKTIRIRDRMQYELYAQPMQQISVVQPDQLPDTSLVREVDRIVDKNRPNFVHPVPSVEEGVKITSYEFINNLFEQGTLNPTKVLPEGSKSPGQIQHKKPRPEVVEYLLALGMVSVGENRMLFYNYTKYPTLVEAKRAIKHGVREGTR